MTQNIMHIFHSKANLSCKVTQTHLEVNITLILPKETAIKYHGSTSSSSYHILGQQTNWFESICLGLMEHP